MARNKMALTPGVRYKGTAVLNEYGQFDFTPYQTGTRPQGMKVVKEEENYSLYESADFYKISVKARKNGKVGMLVLIMTMMRDFQSACMELKKYINEPKKNK